MPACASGSFAVSAEFNCSSFEGVSRPLGGSATVTADDGLLFDSDVGVLEIICVGDFSAEFTAHGIQYLRRVALNAGGTGGLSA
ncbi:MAG: hypothetical protein ACKVT0_21335, partial [Planctomycetaceae bacterium]